MASHLVSQHQQSSFATPINGAAGDATVVLGNDNATVSSYNSHDSDATIHVQDSSAAVFGATPAGTQGRKWMTNDTGAIYFYYDNGSAWVEFNYLRNTGGTVTGNVVVTGTLGVTGASTFTGLTTHNGGATIASGQTLTVTGATITGLTAASVATGTFPGVYTVTGALTLSAALTYGGVTLSNAVTGTGNMVLSASPTFTGTVTTAAISATTGTFSGTVQVSTLLQFAGATSSFPALKRATTRILFRLADDSAYCGVETGTLEVTGLLTAQAGITVGSGQTLTLTGATVAGTPTWSSSQAITLSTAAQPNITSVGTLTSLTVSGNFSVATTKKVALNVGATSYFAETASDTVKAFVSSNEVLQLDGAALTSGDTALLIRVRSGPNTFVGARIVIGAADSGGAGFMMLRIANT